MPYTLSAPALPVNDPEHNVSMGHIRDWEYYPNDAGGNGREHAQASTPNDSGSSFSDQAEFLHFIAETFVSMFINIEIIRIFINIDILFLSKCRASGYFGRAGKYSGLGSVGRTGGGKLGPSECGAPGGEFAGIGAGGMGGAGGGQADQFNAIQKTIATGCHMPPEQVRRGTAVERDPLQARMTPQQRGNVIGDESPGMNVGIQTAGTMRRMKNIPQHDSAGGQPTQPNGIGP